MLLNMTQHAHNVASKQQQQAQGAHPPLTMIPASNNSVSNNAAATIPNSNNNNNNNATTYTPGATSLYNQPLSAANIYIPQGVHPPVGAATAAVYPAMIPTSNVYVNNVTANVNLHGWPHTVPAYISGGAPHYIHGEVPTDQNGPILQSMPAIQPVALTTSNAIAVQSSASSSSGLSTRGSRRGRGRGGSSGSRRGDYNAQRNPPSESSPAPGQQPQQQPQNQDQSLGQQPQQTSTQQQQQLEVVQPAYAPHPQYTSPYQYATYPAAYFSPQNHILHPAQAATQPATGQPLYVPIYPGHQLYNYQYIPQMMNPGEYQFVPGDDVQCDERQNPDGMVPQIWHHQSMYPEEYAMNTADMQADEINQNAPSLTSSETPSMLSPNYHIYDPQIHEMQQQMSVMQIYDDQQITQITGMHPGGAIPELQDEISECGVPNAAIQMVSTSAMLAPIHMQGDSHIMHHHMHDPSQQAPPHHLIPAPIVAIETHQQVELAAEHVMVDSYVDSTEIATLQSSDSNTNLSEINQQSCESISQEYQQQVAVDELHQQQQPETMVSHYSSHNVSTSSELPSETSELQQNLPTTEPAVTPISERADAASVQQQPQPHSFVPSTFTHHHHQQHRQQMEQQQVDFHQQEQQQCEEEQQDQLEQQQQQQDHQLEHQQLENQQQEHHHQDYQQRDYQQQDYQQQDYQQQDYQQQDYQQQDYQQQDYQQQDYQQQEYQQQDYQQQEQQQQDYEQQEYEQQEHQQQEHQHSELEHYEQQMRRPQRLDAQHQQTRQQDTQHLEHQQHGQQQLPLHQQKQTHQHHQKYQYNNHQQYSEHESCEQHEKQQQYQSQQHHQYFPKHQRSYYSHQNDQQQPYRKQSYHYTQRNYIPRFHNNNNANNQHQHQSNMSGNSSDNSLQTTKSMSWTKSYQKKSTASVSVTATPAANNKTMSGTYIHGTKSYTNHQHHYQQQHQHHYPHQSQHHYNYQQQQPHTRNHGAMKTPSSPTMNTSGPHFERRQNQGESYYQRPTSTSTASTTAVPQQFQNQDQRQQQISSQSEYTSYVTKHAHSHQNQNYYLNKKNSAAATTSAEPTPPAAPTMNLAPPQPAGGAATSVSSPNTWASLFNNKSSRAPSSTFTVTPSTQSSATVAQPNTVPSASNGTATSIKKPVAKVAPYEGITPTSPAPPLVTPGSMSYSAASAQNLVPAATASATSVATTAADRPAKPEPALPSKSLDEWSVKFADFLTKHKTDLAPISLRPRGLTNRSNYCYINSILQALLGCAPFYNLIRAIPKQAAALCDVKTPTINAMLSFMGNFSSLPSGVRLNNRLNKAGPKGKDSQGSELQCDSAFEPTEIYRLWNESRDEHVEGRQEDAEEFLGYVLNKLNDEMLEVIKLVAKPGDQNGHDPQSENEDGDAWQMICNNRNKGSVTRQTDFGRTPLSDIFRGELRSRLQREGEISTDVIQPFFTLQLNIEKAASVKEALEILVGRDQLEGVTGSKSKQEVVAWQQMTLEKLPVVLILHLKWFDYRSDGCTKILKTVEFPVELKIDPKILASKKYSQKQRTYRLFAVVYHDGKEASKGHYITDVYHTGYSNWLRFDDSSVKPVGEQNVLHPHMPRVPYLLYYRRYDTLPQAFASTGYQSGSTAAAQAGTRDAK